MRVSFIIPLYNCLSLTQAMLASLQRTIPAGLTHEIIFVDDGSTDGTRDWLQTLNTPAFRVILNERNLGYAAANNRAAAIARGEFLVLLNNDLILTPRWLEPMMELHASRTDIGIVGNVQLNARTGATDHTGFFINYKAKPQQDRTDIRHLAKSSKSKLVIAVTGACLLIKRDLWAQLNGFDEQFRNGCEDVDLCLRARAQGQLTAVAVNSIIRHHISASPGRRDHDEKNTRHLVERWEREFVQLGAAAWARHFFEADLNAATAFASPIDAAKIALFSAGWLKSPPCPVVQGITRSLRQELSRWRHLSRSNFQ